MRDQNAGPHRDDAASGTAPTRPHEQAVAELVAEAVTLVAGGCATTVAIRALRQRADAHGDAALEQAADRCERAKALHHRLQRGAAHLLRSAAAETRRARRRPAEDTAPNRPRPPRPAGPHGPRRRSPGSP